MTDDKQQKIKRKPKRGPSKKSTYVDGIYFRSGAEAMRYEQLKRLELQDKIANLRIRPEYPIAVNGHEICRFHPTFRYDVIDELGRPLKTKCQDVRDNEPQHAYNIKRALMRAVYQIDVEIINADHIRRYEGIA